MMPGRRRKVWVLLFDLQDALEAGNIKQAKMLTSIIIHLIQPVDFVPQQHSTDTIDNQPMREFKARRES